MGHAPASANEVIMRLCEVDDIDNSRTLTGSRTPCVQFRVHDRKLNRPGREGVAGVGVFTASLKTDARGRPFSCGDFQQNLSECAVAGDWTCVGLGSAIC